MIARLVFVAALAIAVPLPALAQTFDQGKVEVRLPRNPAMVAHDHGIESENLFGLTLGSDIDPAGSKAIALEVNGRIGARSGRAAAFGAKLEFAYGITDNISASASVLGGWRYSSNVPGAANFNAFDFDGFGGELRWRFLQRGPSPIGLTLHLEPSVRFADEKTGEKGQGWSSENKLIVDAALIPDKLFIAGNLIYDVETFRVSNSPMEKASTGGVSTALTYQIVPDLFLGADIRYLRAYDGLAFDRFRGWAAFAGPTLFWHFSERAWLSAEYAFQFAGREQGLRNTYDLGNFPRQLLRFKIGMEF